MSDPRIIDITLDEATITWRNPDIEQERRVAIFDLIEENSFKPLRSWEAGHKGPYRLALSVVDGRLSISIRSEDDEPPGMRPFAPSPPPSARPNGFFGVP